MQMWAFKKRTVLALIVLLIVLSGVLLFVWQQHSQEQNALLSPPITGQPTLPPGVSRSETSQEHPDGNPAPQSDPVHRKGD